MCLAFLIFTLDTVSHLVTPSELGPRPPTS